MHFTASSKSFVRVFLSNVINHYKPIKFQRYPDTLLGSDEKEFFFDDEAGKMRL